MGLEGAPTTPSTCTSVRLVVTDILGIQSTRFRSLPNMSSQGKKVMLKTKSGRWIEKSCLFVRK